MRKLLSMLTAAALAVSLGVFAAPLTARAATGPVEIGGTDLPIDTNHNNLATEGWHWDSATYTLTLNGYNGSHIHITSNRPVTINVVSDSTVTAEGYGIYCNNNLTITGEGKLDVTVQASIDDDYTTINAIGIRAEGVIIISGKLGTVSVKNDLGSAHAISATGSFILSEGAQIDEIIAECTVFENRQSYALISNKAMTINGEIGRIVAGGDNAKQAMCIDNRQGLVINGKIVEISAKGSDSAIGIHTDDLALSESGEIGNITVDSGVSAVGVDIRWYGGDIGIYGKIGSITAKGETTMQGHGIRFRGDGSFTIGPKASGVEITATRYGIDTAHYPPDGEVFSDSPVIQSSVTVRGGEGAFRVLVAPVIDIPAYCVEWSENFDGTDSTSVMFPFYDYIWSDAHKHVTISTREKDVFVGEQRGKLRIDAGKAQIATYPVMTGYIKDGSYPVTLFSAPTGVTVLEDIVIEDGKGTLTLVYNGDKKAVSSYSVIEINGMESNDFRISVSDVLSVPWTGAVSNIALWCLIAGGSLVGIGAAAWLLIRKK